MVLGGEGRQFQDVHITGIRYISPTHSVPLQAARSVHSVLLRYILVPTSVIITTPSPSPSAFDTASFHIYAFFYIILILNINPLN